MATDFDVITYANGAFLYDVFNGVAAIFGNSSYSAAMATCMTAASIGIMISAVLQGKMVNLLWMIQAIFLYMAIVLPKVSVNIVDKTEIEISVASGGGIPSVRRVDNVPIGMAIVASSVSTFSSWSTDAFETVFSLPNSIKYTANGPLFGQNLVMKMLDYRPNDASLANNLQEFWKNCVFYDIGLGFYSFDELSKQTDIMSFLKTNTAMTRGFYRESGGSKAFIDCRAGAAALEADMIANQKDFQFNSGNEANVTMPTTNGMASSGWTAMPVAFAYLSNVSKTSSQLLIQSAMMNSMDSGLQSLAGNVDADAAIQGYALARAERERETTFGVMGKMAAEMLPILKNLMEGLMYAIFPFVGLAILFPNGWKAFGYYAKMLLWIGLWPVAFALLHYAMTFFGSFAIQKAAAYWVGSNYHPAEYNIYSQMGLKEVMKKYEAIAGYMMTMIPMVTYVMVAQGGAMMAGMVGRIMDGYAKPAESAAMEASAGNFSVGNTSFENQSAFQHISAPSQIAGSATTNDGRYTNTASQYGITTKQDQSNLVASPSTSKSMERATAQAVETAESHVSSTTTNLAKGRDEAIREAFTAAKSGSSVTSAGTATQQQDQATITKMTEAMVSSAKEFAKGQDWSADQKQSFVNEVGDQFNRTLAGGLSIGGGIGKKGDAVNKGGDGTGIAAGGNVGVQMSNIHTESDKVSNARSSGTGENAQNMDKFLASEQGKTALQNVQSIAQSTSSGRMSTSSKSEDYQQAHSVSKLQKLEEARSEALQEQSIARQMQSDTQKDGFGINVNQTDAMLSDFRKSGVDWEKGLVDIQAGKMETREAIQTQKVMDDFVQRNIQERLDVAKESARIKTEGQDAQADLKTGANIATSVKNTGRLAGAAEEQAKANQTVTESKLKEEASNLNNKSAQIAANQQQGSVNVKVAIESNGAYPRPQDPDDIPKPPEVVGDIPPNPSNPQKR